MALRGRAILAKKFVLPLRSFATGPHQPLTSRWSDDLWNKARVMVTGVTMAGTVLYFAWLRESEHGVTNAMIKKFEQGADISEWNKADAGATIQRNEIHGALMELLHPAEISKYAIIVGEKDTGKSTAIRQVIRAIKEPKGITYMLVPPGGSAADFVTTMQATIGYRKAFYALDRFRSYIRGETRTETPSTWDEMSVKLKAVAKAYEAKHGRPLVFVIDSVDRVAKKSPELLLQLQSLAKDGADSSNLRVVFASTEGATLPILLDSSRSLMPFEVSDIPDKTAVQFLESRGLSTELAKEAVSVYTGGRFGLLLDIVSTTIPLHQMRKVYDTNLEGKLQVIGLKATDKLFEELVSTTRIPVPRAMAMVGQGKLGELLKANILAVHPDESYTFQSRRTQAFFTSVFASPKKQ